MGGLVKGVRLGWFGRVVGYSEVTPGCEPQRTSADPSAAPFLRSGSGRDDIAQFNHFRPIPIRSSRKPAAFATHNGSCILTPLASARGVCVGGEGCWFARPANRDWPKVVELRDVIPTRP